MTRVLSSSYAFVLGLSILATAALGDDWGHWRGPTGNGVSLTAKPPVEWSEQSILWKVPIPGRGSGTPAVWGDQILVTSAVPKNGSVGPERTEMSFTVFSFSRTDGKLQWSQVAKVATPHQDTHSTNGFASASPCTDGEHVYAHFGSQGLYCYTMDGKLVWKRDDLGKMDVRNSFGEGSSPTLAGEKLILPWDHEGASYLAALDKKTGKTIWKTDRDEPTCWATPLVVEYAGKQQIIMNGQNYARSYDLESGRELWRCSGQTQRPVASPLIRDDVVYVGSGFRGAYMGAFKLDGSGDIAGSEHVVWDINEDTPDVASPILSENRIYFYKGQSGILTCLNADTGKPFYSASRVPGVNKTYASPVAAGGYVYLTDRNGSITVIKDADKLEVVATNQMGEGVDATPVPVDKQLIVRGERHLFCIQ